MARASGSDGERSDGRSEELRVSQVGELRVSPRQWQSSGAGEPISLRALAIVAHACSSSACFWFALELQQLAQRSV